MKVKMMMLDSTDRKKPIRSFVRRQGRMTMAQTRALESLWSRYGVAKTESLIDFEAVFGRIAPVTLEIGFGMGHSLLTMAARAPEINFLGIEVHEPGIGSLLNELDAQAIDNVRILNADAVEVLKSNIPDQSLDRVLIYFPDPWPKRRHHKRRLVNPAFLELLAKKLKPGGLLHLATDWEDYAQEMLCCLEASEQFVNQADVGGFVDRPETRPLTKFERRGHRLGHGVWDLLYALDSKSTSQKLKNSL